MTLAEDIAGWLRENRGPDGRVLDPVHHENGTYADGWAALVFGLMAYRTGDAGWGRACDESLRIARAQPPDSEFDQLALLLLALAAERHGGAPPGSTGVPRRADIALYPGGRLVSNNWVAMRALSRSLQAAAPDPSLTALWERVLGWQGPSGLFRDAPIGVATPVTYHAKFCAMLGLAALLTPDRCPLEAIKAALRRGLDALVELISPAGMLAPYGRSRNALFGYAAAVTALRCGAKVLKEPPYLWAANSLLRRLRQAQQADGHIPCVLGSGEQSRCDWDVYVNNPDYNAYAAGLLALEDELLGPLRGAPPAFPKDGVKRVGPLLVARRAGVYAVFSAEGESAPYGTPFFCDYRYYGMQLLYLERDGETLWTPIAYRWPGEDRERLTYQPRAWLPAVEGRYCVRVYDEVRVEQRGMRVRIEGRGVPELYLSVGRWERALRRVLKRPPLQFHSRKLAGVTLIRRLEFNLETCALWGGAVLEGGDGMGLELGLTGWDPDPESAAAGWDE